MDVERWKQHVRQTRKLKDQFFGSDPQSPLPGRDQLAFKGLAYWPPDPACRFELALDVYPDKQVVKVADTVGQERPLWRWGRFTFRLDGQACELQAYKSDPDEERLFVPFRDGTSGRESYGAGRYLDLDPDRHLTAAGRWVVDLNDAYNPWCAYSEDYACPFVPPENWLSVPVRAGEKAYPKPKH